jgi:hypothetical protein
MDLLFGRGLNYLSEKEATTRLGGQFSAPRSQLPAPLTPILATRR